MKRSPDEQPPAVIDFLMNIMMTAGVYLVILSLPLGIALPLQIHYKLHWDWTWTGILAVVMTITFITVGCLLDLGGSLIAKWWWGVSLSEIYWGSKGKQ